MKKKPTITIEYCPKCGWLLRSAYLASELLTTFTEDVQGVMLCPSETSGRFWIAIDGELILDRAVDGFPEITVLKQLVRDHVAPNRSLGHADRK